MVATLSNRELVLLLIIIVIASIGLRIRWLQYMAGDRDSPGFYGFRYRPPALIQGGNVYHDGSDGDSYTNNMFESPSLPESQLF